MNYRLLSGLKKNKVWIWTTVNHFQPGILAWAVGDRSAKTFELMWQIVCGDVISMSQMVTRFIRATFPMEIK